ncbi:MAG TPA: pantoate--beta-alanine ligase [Thermoleophilia bacterium]|nr:pantoate--beta-alanine ligase [Thermoleophilia bacterium]
MRVARTVVEARDALPALTRPLGLVPTMGALHEGHLSLVRAARERCAAVAASLFVNPTQFGGGEDLARYPRDEARDLALFAEAGVDVVFAPAPAEMYAADASTTVHVGGPIGECFEAADRPGHFDGVATVVTKLLTIVAPDLAFFGRKDAQQLALIRRLVRDLDLPVEVAAVPTVREPDGLAMSSRNAYLTPEQRAVAPDLYRALLAGRAAAGKPGVLTKDVIAATAMSLVMPDPRLITEDDRIAEMKGQRRPQPPRFDLDYIAVVDADTFVQESELGPRSLLVAAARLGVTRLIDNLELAPIQASTRPGSGIAHQSPGSHESSSPPLSPSTAPSPSTAQSPSAYPVGDATGTKGR